MGYNSKTFSLLALILLLTINIYGKSSTKRVLYLNSYSPEFPTSDLIIKPIQNTLENASVYINISYLYTKEHYNSKYFEQLYNHFHYKLNNEAPYDLIITSDDHALEFVLKHHDNLFNNLPVVFMGINNQELGLAQNKNPLATGFIEHVCMDENLLLMQKLQPEIEEVIAICDNSISGIGDLLKFKSFESKYPNLKFSFINTENHDQESLKNILSKADPKKTAFLLIAFYHDREGKYYNFSNGTNFIAENSSAPLYHLWLHGMNKRILGGVVIDLSENAKQVAQLALKVLNGTPISSFKTTTKSKQLTFVDYKQILHYNLGFKNIPVHASLINKPVQSYPISLNTIIATIIIITILIITLFLTFYNIRKRKRIEKELLNSQDKYQRLFDHSPDIIVITDPISLKIKDINEKGLEILHKSKEELVNKDHKIIFSKSSQLGVDAAIKRLTERLLLGKPIKSIEAEIKTSENQIIAVDIRGQLITIDSKLYVQGVFHNISARKETEKVLLQAKEKAEESDQLKSAFLANMSHEVRTPMNAIIGFSELISRPKISPKNFKKYIGYIQKNCLTLLQLINDIIDIAKIEADQLTLNYSKMNVFSLFNELHEVFTKELESYPEKNIKIEYKLDAKIPATITSDYIRMKQILTNLISNSIKFTEEGSIKFGCKKTSENEIRFYVKDTGTGIPKEKMEVIFKRFEKSDNTRLNLSGTGLGLAISHSLAQMMHGEIGVRSVEDVGSLFYITLPLQVEDNTSVKNQELVF